MSWVARPPAEGGVCGGPTLTGCVPSCQSASQQGDLLAEKGMLLLSNRKWCHQGSDFLVTFWYMGKCSMLKAVFTIEFLPKYQSVTWKSLAWRYHFLCDTSYMAWAFFSLLASPPLPLTVARKNLATLPQLWWPCEIPCVVPLFKGDRVASQGLLCCDTVLMKCSFCKSIPDAKSPIHIHKLLM